MSEDAEEREEGEVPTEDLGQPPPVGSVSRPSSAGWTGHHHSDHCHGRGLSARASPPPPGMLPAAPSALTWDDVAQTAFIESTYKELAVSYTAYSAPFEFESQAELDRFTGNPLYSGTRYIPARIIDYRVYFA